jgi:TonB-linked SusC/RagA family outer membrane protein
MNCLRLPKLLLLFLLLCSSFFGMAQERTVTGKVIDQQNGKPLEGVSIRVKNTQTATITDENGDFSIKVPSTESILTFSYVGFGVYETKAGTNPTLSISMTQLDLKMNEVVVVGYGSKPRANVLGSVGTLNPKEIEDLPVPNLATSLINKVPGVGITQSSGKPGSNTSLRIRNPVTFASTGASIEPLYVIDGIAFPEPDGKMFFDNLDATMIESISFLKDAAASIYGSRGANGVVLVTTKKGRPGKPRISYSGSVGVSSAIKVPETLSAFEHVTLLNNKYLARTAWNNLVYSQAELDHVKNNNHNWFDEVWQNSYLTRHTINISGGSDRITFFGGANYLKETGNLQDLYAQRYGFRIGSTAKITDNLTADVTFNMDYAIQDRPTPKNIAAFAGQNSDQNDQLNATIGALLLIPRWIPMYVDGKPFYTSAPGWHPKEVQNTNTYARTNNRGQSATVSLHYKVPTIDGLSARISYGQSTRNDQGKEYYVSYRLYDFQRLNVSPLTGTGVTKQAIMITNLPTVNNHVRTIRNGNSLRYSSDVSKSYQLNASINYKKTFGKHDIDVLALAEQSESEGTFFFTSRGGGDGPAQGQTVPGRDEFWAFTADRAYWDNSSSATEAGRLSYLGRLNYSFNDRYLLEGVFRADASTNFPKGKRFGYFPSVAVGWKVSEENFFKNRNHFVNDLKVRFQIGLTGSDAVTAWQFRERYTGNAVLGMLFGSTQTNGLNNGVWPNEHITWEKALYKNLGFDGAFFNRKFNFGIDLYERHNKDMLQSSTSSLPSTFGVAISDQNYAEMKSWGIEGQLTYNGKIGKDFTYSVQANIGWSDNKVLKKYFNAGADTGYKYPIGRRTDTGLEGYQYTFMFRTQADVDAWLAKYPGWTIDGQVPQVGYLNFEDINGDGRITDLDETRIAPRSGSLWGAGFNISMGWRGLRFSINSSLSVGGKRGYDNTARRPPTENQGALALWRDSWSPSNPNAKYPVINAPLASENSTLWMVSGTNMRINNMQLSYSMPQALSRRWKIPEFRAFVVCTNVGDIINHQKYKSSFSNVAVDYPPLRMITFGLNVSL